MTQGLRDMEEKGYEEPPKDDKNKDGEDKEKMVKKAIMC